MRRPPTLFLTVGLPGTGKTTAARRIEVERGALRLTKDEWVKPSTARTIRRRRRT
ncbi:AAA family ATPase [Allobranchiibius sp. GilTou73]|uniref:AAA family ATPase n=1 Tax=Allobranchiibius sp. GilTou73 TaxID=2904523 RepID=UPI001F18C102|nr:AAA family ATPase [Allobranchiibius sp. GilTou73]UIJ34054.1 ATP-binding protein [Allobranchiibius sp. GilTou73]